MLDLLQLNMNLPPWPLPSEQEPDPYKVQQQIWITVLIVSLSIVQVTAHNNAGFATAEYEFATLTVTGGKTVFSFFPKILFFFLDFITKTYNLWNSCHKF